MSSPVFSGIVASLVTPLVLGWAADRTRDVSADRAGWRRLRPGVGLYGMILAVAGFTLLLFYIYFFVGSVRADADKQMRYLLILACVFFCATLWAIWSTFHESVEWQGRMIRVRSLFSGERSARLENLESIEYSSLQSMFVLRFRYGMTVKASPYMNGTRQLLRHIDEVAPGAASERYNAPDYDDE